MSRSFSASMRWDDLLATVTVGIDGSKLMSGGMIRSLPRRDPLQQWPNDNDKSFQLESRSSTSNLLFPAPPRPAIRVQQHQQHERHDHPQRFSAPSRVPREPTRSPRLSRARSRRTRQVFAHTSRRSIPFTSITPFPLCNDPLLRKSFVGIAVAGPAHPAHSTQYQDHHPLARVYQAGGVL